ncbi:MAG TPA: AraC family transcriptional regulator [Puia sp.]|nr:AraC family transcriptional regulator [Puia sp.]
MLASDSQILDAYKEVFRRFTKDGVIDMDKRLKHKFSYQIHRLEDVVPRLGGVVPPNRQSMYYITFFLKGEARKSVGMFNFEITKNTLVLIPRRVIHSTLYDSLHCSGYVLNFNIDFFLNNAFPKKLIAEKKVFKSSVKPYLSVSAAQQKQLVPVFEAILQENAAALLGRNQMIAVKILELLILCDRMFTEVEAMGKESIYHPTVEKFDELIEDHFTKDRSVAFYADALNVHPGHLNFLMKKHNGMSAKQTIDNRVAMEAQSLLATTSWSVKEIADRLGFSDANNFSSFFSRMTKVSPTAYRAKFV